MLSSNLVKGGGEKRNCPFGGGHPGCAQTGQSACLLLDRLDLFPEALQSRAFLLVIHQIWTAPGRAAPSDCNRGWGVVPWTGKNKAQHSSSACQGPFSLFCSPASLRHTWNICAPASFLNTHIPPGWDKEGPAIVFHQVLSSLAFPTTSLPYYQPGRVRQM